MVRSPGLKRSSRSSSERLLWRSRSSYPSVPTPSKETGSKTPLVRPTTHAWLTSSSAPFVRSGCSSCRISASRCRRYRLDNYLRYGGSAAAIGVALFPAAEHEAEPWTGEWLASGTSSSRSVAGRSSEPSSSWPSATSSSHRLVAIAVLGSARGRCLRYLLARQERDPWPLGRSRVDSLFGVATDRRYIP
jgi:hypothetical protein